MVKMDSKYFKSLMLSPPVVLSSVHEQKSFSKVQSYELTLAGVVVGITVVAGVVTAWHCDTEDTLMSSMAMLT